MWKNRKLFFCLGKKMVEILNFHISLHETKDGLDMR